MDLFQPWTTFTPRQSFPCTCSRVAAPEHHLLHAAEASSEQQHRSATLSGSLLWHGWSVGIRNCCSRPDLSDRHFADGQPPGCCLYACASAAANAAVQVTADLNEVAQEHSVLWRRSAAVNDGHSVGRLRQDDAEGVVASHARSRAVTTHVCSDCTSACMRNPQRERLRDQGSCQGCGVHKPDQTGVPHAHECVWFECSCCMVTVLPIHQRRPSCCEKCHNRFRHKLICTGTGRERLASSVPPTTLSRD